MFMGTYTPICIYTYMHFFMRRIWDVPIYSYIHINIYIQMRLCTCHTYLHTFLDVHEEVYIYICMFRKICALHVLALKSYFITNTQYTSS